MAVSRDVIGAIGDLADQAAETAGHLLHRRRARGWRRWASRRTIVLVASILVASGAVVLAMRARAGDGRADSTPAETLPD